MKFYPGLHHPAAAQHFPRAFISINTVRGRKKPVPSSDWILDSGAFRELEQCGGYRHSPADYAAEVNRLAAINPGLRVAVSQDWMCEPFMLAKTGLTVADHQRLTIERYDALLPLVSVHPDAGAAGLCPGRLSRSYRSYGDRLKPGMLVGVGSICKRNVDMRQIEAILSAIKRKRPDLRLHGFGIKLTALGQWRGARLPVFGRQHGVELRSPTQWWWSERLAQGGCLRRPYRAHAVPARVGLLTPAKLMRELRAERQRRGIRLIDLQEAVGYHRTAIGNWERGKYSPPLVALADLCDALNINLRIEIT